MKLRSFLVVIAVLLSFGCGGAKAPPADATVVLPATDASVADSDTQAPPPAPVADASAPTCAVSFDAPSKYCKYGEAPCNYPEGTCECGPPPHCGGAMMRAPQRGETGLWYCTPKDTSRLRADGCTYAQPADGAPCSKPDMSCVYGECAWSAATARCTKGKWRITQYHGPGPP